MINIRTLDHELVRSFPARRASPIFVPEIHGRYCRMVSGVILWMMFDTPLRSSVSGESVNAFPAKTMSPKRSILARSRNERSTCFAHSSRLGAMSPASIDFDRSRRRTISFPGEIGTFSLETRLGSARRKNMKTIMQNRNPQSIFTREYI